MTTITHKIPLRNGLSRGPEASLYGLPNTFILSGVRAQKPEVAGQHHVALRYGEVWLEARFDHEPAPRTRHRQQIRRRGISVKDQGAMTFVVEHGIVGDGAIA